MPASIQLPAPPANFEWNIAATDDEVYSCFKDVLRHDVFAMDVESNGKKWWNFNQSDIAGISFTTPELKNYYIPLNQVRHSVEQVNAKIPLVRAFIRTAIKNKHTIIGGNLKFDWHVYYRTLGLDLRSNPSVDILLISHLININDQHSVKHIGTALIGEGATFWEKMIVNVRQSMGITKKHPLWFDYRSIPLYAIAPYACCDTWLTMLGYKHFMRHPKLTKFADYIKLEHKVARHLFTVEETGIKIDRPYAEGILEGFNDSIPLLEAKMNRHAGKYINCRSDEQLMAFFYDEVKLPKQTKVDMKTHETKVTLDKTALLALQDMHPAIKLLQDFRREEDREEKIKAIVSNLDSQDRIHSTFNQFKEGENKLNTGRLSSSDPVNVENIPASDTTIRRCFIPDTEFLIMDYSGQEIRVYVHNSKEPRLVEAYKNNLDVHSVTTESVFNIPYAKIVEGKAKKIKDLVDKRDFAKRFFFGKLYGSGLGRVAEVMAEYGMGYSLKEAKRIDDNFMMNMPRFKKYMKELEYEYYQKGYIEDDLGRQYVPRDPNKLYVLLNYKIQGTSSGILKTTFVRVCEEVAPNIVANLIHDELDMDRLENREMAHEIKRIAEDWDHVISLPMPVEMSYGYPSWEDKTAIDDLNSWVNERKVA